MKNTLTIEDEFALVIDFITEMAKNGNLSQKEADLLINEFMELQEQREEGSNCMLSPGKHVIMGIMNYSKSLKVSKNQGNKPVTMIVN